MKKSIYVTLLSLSCFIYAQNKEDIKLKIESERSEFAKIQNQYFDLIRNSENLIYKDKKEGKYSYYSKPKYDSLANNKLDNSIILQNSILKISLNINEYYIMKIKNLKNDDYEFYKYKGDKLISIERGNYISQLYSKEDLVELTKDDFCGNNQCLYKYTFMKYSKLDSRKEFSNILYSIQINHQDIASERFYDKDFSLDKKILLKMFISKFQNQALPLMKQVKYIRQHGGVYKTFDFKDLEYEVNLIKPKIIERERAENGFYNDKNSILKYNAEKAVEIRKEYDSTNQPYYDVLINVDMKKWKFRINSSTGDIEKIEYFLVFE